MQTKKIITLSLVIGFILFTAISLFTKSTLPEPYSSMVSMIVAYYFGKGSNESKA